MIGIIIWVVHDSSPIMCSISKLNKRNAAKSMSIFNFWTRYFKILQKKLLYVLNEITHFAFKGRTRDDVTVLNLVQFWSRSKCKAGICYSLQEVKSCLEFLISNSYFHLCFKIFLQVLRSPMWSDSASSLLTFFCSLWI